MKTKNKNKINTTHTRKVKKAIAVLFSAMIIFALSMISVSAAGTVDTSSFISSSMTVIKAVICLIGAGLGVWGVVNLIEGYGNDNPGAKSQGMKQFMAGLALIVLGLVIVPVLQNMMTSATT